MFKNIETEKLINTENENSIYMPEGSFNLLTKALKTADVHLDIRPEKIPSTNASLENLEERVNWYRFFIEKSYECRIDHVIGGCVRKDLYYYENKNTGEYEFGNLIDFRQKATDTSTENRSAIFVAYEKNGVKKLFSVERMMGAWGTYVFFRYDVDSFVNFALDILSDHEGIDEMLKAEQEKDRKEMEDYRKDHPALFAKTSGGHRILIG